MTRTVPTMTITASMLGIKLPDGFSARITGIPGGIQVQVGDEWGGSMATALGDSFTLEELASQVHILAQHILDKRERSLYQEPTQ